MCQAAAEDILQLVDGAPPERSQHLIAFIKMAQVYNDDFLMILINIDVIMNVKMVIRHNTQNLID